MSRSLSLAAYRAFTRRGKPPDTEPQPARPEGELLWLHGNDAERLSALNDVAHRVRLQRPGLKVLVTCDTPPAERPDAADWVIALDGDHPSTARHFVQHWRPDFCLWTGNELLLNLLSSAAEAGVPLVLCDVGTPDFHLAGRKWIPHLTRASLDLFDMILTRDDSGMKAVRRMGVAPAKVAVGGHLRAGCTPSGCDEDLLAELTSSLGARLIWLAVNVEADEVATILAAHRQALRLSHRLLLVLLLADDAATEALQESLATSRLRVAYSVESGTVEDNVQVVLSDASTDLGLWYRLAPLVFLASSLHETGRGGIDPMEAAALGSAILCGPHVERHAALYERLASVGAAHTVSDADSLGTALVQLVAPDHAATMALAGWEVATEGAELTDRLVDMVQDALDVREATLA